MYLRTIQRRNKDGSTVRYEFPPLSTLLANSGCW
jgi:hypothetical protein